MILYHGSEKIIRAPRYGFGSTKNDYGRGFYCTENAELGKEWACRKGTDGFLNAYELDTSGFNICNLNGNGYNILNWLAVLTHYRSYWQKNSIAEDAKDFLQERYFVDLSDFDIIIGYRADDSYFSFAQDFIMGTISIQQLYKAMYLGKLGEQVVLKSKRSFQQLRFQDSIPVDRHKYYTRKNNRDLNARKDYAKTKRNSNRLEEIFIIDIMRGLVNIDDIEFKY